MSLQQLDVRLVRPLVAEEDRRRYCWFRVCVFIHYVRYVQRCTPTQCTSLHGAQPLSLESSVLPNYKKFLNSISQPDSCLRHLLPPPRDTQLITKLLYANTYPVPLIKTKSFCSFNNFGLANYVDWLYFCILCVGLYCVYILHIVLLYFCRPILIYVELHIHMFVVRQELSRIFCIILAVCV